MQPEQRAWRPPIPPLCDPCRSEIAREGIHVQATGCQAGLSLTSTPLRTSYLTLGKSLPFSKPQFLHL